MVQEAPVFLHTEHGVPRATKDHHIFFQQLVGKSLQAFLRGAARRQHARVADEATAQHHRIYVGKLGGESRNILHRIEISVITQGIFAVGSSIAEHFHIHAAGVELLSHPGVDSQFLDGIAVKYFQQGREFFRVFKP